MHARRAASAYQLAVRPGSDGEFMGACCSLIRIVGDEEPELFAGLTGSRAFLDKALRRIDQNPEGAAVVAIRLAQKGPGAIHYLMGSTSNKKLDDALKVARGVWLCDVTTALAEASAATPALESWIKRKASEIRGIVRRTGWGMPADGAAVGAAPDETRGETGASDNDKVAYARGIGRTLNRIIDTMSSVASASPALISKDGSVVRKVFSLKSMFASENKSWIVDSLRDIVVNHARRNADLPRNIADMTTVDLDGLKATLTIQLTAKPAEDRAKPPPPPPRQERPGGAQMREALRVAKLLDEWIYLYRRSAKNVQPAEISESFFAVKKVYTVAQPAREVKMMEDQLRWRAWAGSNIVQKTVHHVGKDVIITIHLGKVEDR
jgi:hypothetical protein